MDIKKNKRGGYQSGVWRVYLVEYGKEGAAGAALFFVLFGMCVGGVVWVWEMGCEGQA